ncbi:MAG: alpha/beta fold hydrolase [Bacteroidia bacterium]|nr:alpha/beta fold hydrolase [Bacteroidia bacterium]MDW8088986.1 alpha/beta fold hydrolase [Bacteroidia bacterium]
MRLYFERLGGGEPIYVFLHGLFGNADNWRSVVKQLDLAGTFYLVDARNHGRSPHTSSHTYAEQAQDVLELLGSEGHSSAHLLGHSMGGKTAMYLALNFPEFVRSLVVGDIAPRAYSGGHEAVWQALRQADLSVKRREEVEAQLAPFIPDKGVRQFLLKNLARDAQGRFYWRINLEGLYAAYPAILAAVSGRPYMGPALFLRGEHSDYLRPEDELEIKALFPRAAIEVVPQAGHWIHVDSPTYVVQALRRFWAPHFMAA